MGRIVVGVDGSQWADRALRWAVRQAASRRATLDVVHAFVIHPYSVMFGDTDRDLAQARLNRVIERNRTHLDQITWSSELTDAAGSAAAALLERARDVELLVVGARGAGGFARLMLGATGYRAAAHASVPVAVVAGTNEAMDGHRGLVVGVDGSASAARALHWACDEAVRRGTSVTAVHAYELPTEMAWSAISAMEQFDRARERARTVATSIVGRAVDDLDVAPGTVHKAVAVGPAAGALLELQRDRLLVIGTRGHSTFRRATFGSVGLQVLHHAQGPVVVVP